jgi:Glycosyltransferase 61
MLRRLSKLLPGAFVETARKSIRRCRGLAFDWRFRPRKVCRDPARHGVAAYDVSFDNCKHSYQVFRVPNARLQTDRNKYIAVTAQNELLPGPSFQWLGFGKPELPPEQSPAFGWGRIGSVPRRVRGTVFSLLTGRFGNDSYYHWLTAVLPRIYLVEKAGLIANVDFYLVPDDALRFQFETLDLLGIPREARISSRKTPHVAADAVIATTHPFPDEPCAKWVNQDVPRWIVEWLRDAFLEKSSHQEYSRFVYIGRADARQRRLLNEDECFSTVLQPLGFEAYQLSKMPFTSQIRLFAGADAIVGIHGAALTNLSFCRSGTSVVELFAAPWRLRMFEKISNLRGLNYHAIVCPGHQTDVSPEDPDFVVPLEELATKLRLAVR